MHDIVKVEFLPQNQSHAKKGPSSEKDRPTCFVYPLNNACAAFQIMAIAKMRTVTIPTTSRNVSRPEKIVFATGSWMKAKPVNMAIKNKM